jgi:probable HAF family extracellular repeat protein
MTLLGTFGGSISIAYGINNHGDVVGYARTNDQYNADHAFLYANGVLHDLNDLVPPPNPGVSRVISYANDINDSGEIVCQGNETDLTTLVTTYYSYFCAVTFDANGNPLSATLTQLGEFGAQGINSLGDITGNYDPPNGAQRGFISWDGVFSDIGDLGSDPVFAGQINTAGEVAGSSDTLTGYYHAFRYNHATGAMLDLGFLKANAGGIGESFASGINENGQVTGMSSAGGRVHHAFRYTDNVGMIDLGVLGSNTQVVTSSSGYGININGDVVGRSTAAYSTSYQPFLYTNAWKMVDLNTLILNVPVAYQGYLGYGGMRINDSRVICGAAGTSDGTVPIRAYVLVPQ